MRRTSGEGRPRPISACWRTSKTTSKNHPVHYFFQRRTPAARILLSAPRVPLRADKRRPLSRRLSYSSRPIPVDSFQFRIYRDLGPPPASRNHASIVASSPDSPEGPCTNEDRTGERESVPRSFGVRPLLSFAPPISLSFCFFLSPSIICITSNLET